MDSCLSPEPNLISTKNKKKEAKPPCSPTNKDPQTPIIFTSHSSFRLPVPFAPRRRAASPPSFLEPTALPAALRTARGAAAAATAGPRGGRCPTGGQPPTAPRSPCCSPWGVWQKMVIMYDCRRIFVWMCMYVYVCVCMNVYMYIYICIYIHVYIYIIHTYMHMNVLSHSLLFTVPSSKWPDLASFWPSTAAAQCPHDWPRCTESSAASVDLALRSRAGQ